LFYTSIFAVWFCNTQKIIIVYRKPLVPTKAARPMERKPVSANFDDATTHKEDFRKWPLGERTKPMMKPDYCAPEAPFEGMSTFKAHYTPKPISVPRNFKPDNSQMNSGPFDGNTMYRTDYVPKEAEPCPAAILDTGKSKYIYEEQNEVGHKFYRPAFESIMQLPGTGGQGFPAAKISNVAFA